LFRKTEELMTWRITTIF